MKPPPGGCLVLVGTPIGNLGDLSPRASEALATADLVCCEDTRRTGRLLQMVGISGVRLRRLDQHNETRSASEICRLVAGGKRVAVVSDAGMPCVSDPGERLVAACIAAGLAVSVVPGPSAATAALAVSGLSTARYVFEGFLPRKGPSRRKRLAQIATEPRTVVLFESPHRLESCLADLAKSCGAQRRAAVVRELTKLHEEVIRGSLAELCDWVTKAVVRGEVALVVDGAPPASREVSDAELLEAAQRLFEEGITRRDAATQLAKTYQLPRRRVYNLIAAS